MQVAALGGGKTSSTAQGIDLRLGWIAGRSHFLIGGAHVAVFTVDPKDQGMRDRMALELQGDSLWRRGLSSGALSWRIVIPDSNHAGSVFAPSRQGEIGINRNALVAKLVEQCKGGECGLRNAVFGHQSKAAVEGLLYDALLFKDIGECPIRHHIDQAIALADSVGEPRPHISRVGYGSFVHVTRVELAPRSE